MSKSLLNQRYCYKINSSYIRRHNGNISIKDIGLGIKNRFIVGLGDGTGTRISRAIINSPYNEEYINSLKSQLKEEQEKSKEENVDKRAIKKAIKNIINNILKAQLQDYICNVVFDSDKDYDKYSKDGFKLNGEKYVLLLGTAGGIKNNTVMFVKESIHDELEKRINNGADFSIPMLPSKLMAYKSLVFSASTPVTNTDKILVVKDVITRFKDKATYIKFNEEIDRPLVTDVDDFDVEVNACDGCGLINPKLAKKWSEDLHLDYNCTGFVIRNSWVKGVLTSFNFYEYCNTREDMKESKIIDVWGREHTVEDLKDIDIIMNESMFKLYKHYKSLEEYLENCNNNGYEFSITKEVPDVLDNERMLNYQYIQCLDLEDEEIDRLINKDIKEIKEVIGENYIKSILFGKGVNLNDKNVWGNNTDDLHIKALMINKDAINDRYIRDKIKRAITKRVDLLKTGKISVNGNYQIAIGEPIIQLESAFGLEPKGLLKRGEFYIKYWKNRNVKRVGGFRSPMSCKSNARIMNISYDKEVEKWYGGIKNMIIFNAWDTSMSAFNGEDFDGDINFTTDNKIIIDGIFDLPAIFCEGASANKISNPTKEDFIHCIKKSFGNKVGSVTNFGSSCYDKMSIFDKDSDKYKEIDYRIKCIQFYQQECIDSAKNGKPPRPIPSYWHNFKDDKLKYEIDEETGDILNEKEVNLFKKTLTEKKPYYFRYIYKDVNKQYSDFIENTEINSLRNFRKTIEELKATKNKTEKEIEFLEWYDKNIPLSNNPCVINKIAHKVETSFSGDFTFERKSNKFDYSIYKNDKSYKPTNSEIKNIINLYKDYVSMNQNQRSKIDYNDKEDTLSSNDDRYEEMRNRLISIIPNKEHLLNVMIDLAYKNKKISDSFVWNVMGDEIINTMLKKADYTIEYPIKSNDGDILYCGQRFKMVEKNLRGNV